MRTEPKLGSLQFLFHSSLPAARARRLHGRHAQLRHLPLPSPSHRNNKQASRSAVVHSPSQNLLCATILLQLPPRLASPSVPPCLSRRLPRHRWIGKPGSSSLARFVWAVGAAGLKSARFWSALRAARSVASRERPATVVGHSEGDSECMAG